jgi:rhodanese-related sulfurtransferase
MKQSLLATIVLFFSLLALPLGAFALSQTQKISGPELQKLVEAKTQPIVIFDANNNEIRAKDGMVAGAKKLSSFNKYALTELPQDKATMVVFYCYNEQCTASHDAADRASAAGYKNVKVMSDGIAGWKSKGLPIAQP